MNRKTMENNDDFDGEHHNANNFDEFYVGLGCSFFSFLFFILFYFISFLFYVCYLLIIKNTHKSTIRSWHIDLQTFTLKMLHIKMLGVCPLYNLVFRIC